jgi:hypothetical protein
MSRALLVYVLNRLLIIKVSPEASSNVKAKNLLHLEKLRKRRENNIKLILN